MTYFYPLNFIRFLLAMGVILFHYGLDYYPFDLPYFKILIQKSGFRVSLFFFISGFVMSLVYSGYQSLTARHFYKRRFSRIFPVYWLAFLFTLLLVVGVNKASPKGLSIILQAVGLQSWNPGFVLDLNFPTWSISVELAFYIIFPFFLRCMKAWSNVKLAAVALIIWILQTAQHIFFVEFLASDNKAMLEFIDTFPLWHLPTFFIGMAAARFVTTGFFSGSVERNPTLYLIFSMLCFCAVIFLPNPLLKYIHNGLLAPLFLLFVVSLYYDTSYIYKFLSLKPMMKLGDLSYNLFIFQYPVWIIVSKSATPAFKKEPVFFFMYLCVLIVVSFIIHSVFEKPVLQYLRKKSE